MVMKLTKELFEAGAEFRVEGVSSVFKLEKSNGYNIIVSKFKSGNYLSKHWEYEVSINKCTKGGFKCCSLVVGKLVKIYVKFENCIVVNLPEISNSTEPEEQPSKDVDCGAGFQGETIGDGLSGFRG